MSQESLGEKIRRACSVVRDILWDRELSSMSAKRRAVVKLLRVGHLVVKGFREDECPLHASALTFNSLMAIVPILALSLALARVFGGEELERLARDRVHDAITTMTTVSDKIPGVMIVSDAGVRIEDEGNQGVEEDVVGSGGEGAAGEDVVTSNAAPARLEALDDDIMTHEQVVFKLNAIVDAGFDQVRKIRFGAIGGVGLAVLLWIVINVLGRVEGSFNAVWGISESRHFWRKVTDYLSAVLILPFLMLLASSLPVVEFVSRFPGMPEMDMGQYKGLTVFFMTWLSFGFVLKFMPNTRVRTVPAIIGGIIAAILFLCWIQLCAAIQIGVARYGRIYGSFAIVPIVLAWVYVSWEIVLFGAEVAFAVQNCTTYQMEQGAKKASARSRILLAVSVLVETGRAMVGDGSRFEVAEYAREKLVPVRFINDVVRDLVHGGYLGELTASDGAYTLLRSPEKIGVGEIADFVMNVGVEPGALGLKNCDPRIERLVAEDARGGGQSATIRDLLSDDDGPSIGSVDGDERD